MVQVQRYDLRVEFPIILTFWCQVLYYSPLNFNEEFVDNICLQSHLNCSDSEVLSTFNQSYNVLRILNMGKFPSRFHVSYTQFRVSVLRIPYNPSIPYLVKPISHYINLSSLFPLLQPFLPTPVQHLRNQLSVLRPDIGIR